MRRQPSDEFFKVAARQLSVGFAEAWTQASANEEGSVWTLKMPHQLTDIAKIAGERLEKNLQRRLEPMPREIQSLTAAQRPQRQCRRAVYAKAG